jgi:L-ascorbate metabolism protein UlaG (beta-lactamase superfamily)
MIGRDVTVTWYGHATWGWTSPAGVRVLVDPFLTGNPRTPADMKRPEADLIVVTHGHGDHVGDVVDVAARTGAPVLAPVEVGDWLEAQGVQGVVAFNQGGTVEQRGIRFTMTKAEHTGGLPATGAGPGPYGGEPKGYVITFENGFRVYHSGDTDIFSEMALIRELWAPDLAVLSIGDHFTMGPYGAAHAVRLLGVRQVLGGHWGTFPVLTGTPAALREELGKLGVDAEVLDIEPGQTLA